MEKKNKEIKIQKETKKKSSEHKEEVLSTRKPHGPLAFLRASLVNYDDCLSKL
jgi:hypothetical protein